MIDCVQSSADTVLEMAQAPQVRAPPPRSAPPAPQVSAAVPVVSRASDRLCIRGSSDPLLKFSLCLVLTDKGSF